MELHPQGVFEASVVDHGFEAGKPGKSASFVVRFATEHSEIQGWFSMSDKAVQYTVEKIRAIGFAGNDLNELADGTALLGCKCKIKVDHETYEGKTRAKVNGVFDINSEPGGQITHDLTAAQQCARAFNALLSKIAAKPVAKTAPRMRQPGDDDIPLSAYEDNFPK